MEFSSPNRNSNSNYDSYLDCHWLVIGSDFHGIQLTFNSFNLEPKRNIRGEEQLCTDYIEVSYTRECVCVGFHVQYFEC